MRPLPPEAWDEEAREVVGRNRAGVGRGGVPNVLATLARHPRLLKAWYGSAGYVIGESTLPEGLRGFDTVPGETAAPKTYRRKIRS